MECCKLTFPNQDDQIVVTQEMFHGGVRLAGVWPNPTPNWLVLRPCSDDMFTEQLRMHLFGVKERGTLAINLLDGLVFFATMPSPYTYRLHQMINVGNYVGLKIPDEYIHRWAELLLATHPFQWVVDQTPELHLKFSDKMCRDEILVLNCQGYYTERSTRCHLHLVQ